VPPIAMLPIWVPCEEWTCVRSEKTDRDGWQYGTDWNASAWRQVPRPLFDLVRRRKWKRRYQLRMSHDDELIDGRWLRQRARASERPSFWELCCCMRPVVGPPPRLRR